MPVEHYENILVYTRHDYSWCHRISPRILYDSNGISNIPFYSILKIGGKLWM